MISLSKMDDEQMGSDNSGGGGSVGAVVFDGEDDDDDFTGGAPTAQHTRTAHTPAKLSKPTPTAKDAWDDELDDLLQH